MHRKVHREDAENRPPSPSLPHLPHSTSPIVPPRLPSPTHLSAEDGATDEDIAITLDARETLFPEGKDLSTVTRLQHTCCERFSVLHLGVCVLQCLCLETENLPIFLLPKPLRPNSATLHPAKYPYPQRQSGRVTCPDRSDTHTCSGPPGLMGRQTLDQTVFRTSTTRTSTLIT